MDFEKISINNNDFYKAKRAILDGFVPSCPEKAKEEIARFRKIVNTVMNVPAGRETLMAVAKQQPPRKFGFETFTDKAGCFTGDKILLNPNVSDKLPRSDPPPAKRTQPRERNRTFRVHRRIPAETRPRDGSRRVRKGSDVYPSVR